MSRAGWASSFGRGRFAPMSEVPSGMVAAMELSRQPIPMCVALGWQMARLYRMPMPACPDEPERHPVRTRARAG